MPAKHRKFYSKRLGASVEVVGGKFDRLSGVEKAFRVYCETGIMPALAPVDLGYVKHCVEIVARNGGTSDGHPLFMRWALEGNGPLIEPFLLKAAEQYKAWRQRRNTVDRKG